MRHGGQRLSFRRQFVLVLVAATLVSTLGTVAAAYFGARAIALQMAETHTAQELRMASQILSSHGQALSISDGQLATDTGYRFNGDPTAVRQITSAVGDAAAIYQVEGDRLVSIASDLPSNQGQQGASTGTESVGTVLDSPVYQVLEGNCPATTPMPASCHQQYLGSIMIQNVAYVAAIVPLLDAQGTCVGALAVATPVERIEAPLRLLAGFLLLIGLGLTALSIVIAYRVSGPVSHRALAALSSGLDDVGVSAHRLDQVARTQVARSTRQVGAARHLIEELRTLSEVATALQHGVDMLRDSTSDVWAEMSHPGVAPDPHACLRAARQVAVVASQLGGSADQAQAFCQRLRAIMNQVIGEASALRDSGQLTEERAQELSTAIAAVEAELGNRLSANPYTGAHSRLAFAAGNVSPRQLTDEAARGGSPQRRLADRLRALRAWSPLKRWTTTHGDPGATGPVHIHPDQDSARLPQAEDHDTPRWPWQHGRVGGPVDRDGAGPSVAGAYRSGESSWPDRLPRPTVQRPDIERLSHPPRAQRPGYSSRLPRPMPPDFSVGMQRATANSGPHSMGSHPSTSGRQRAPWYSDGTDLDDAMRHGEPPQTGAPDGWQPQAFEEQLPPPRPAPRQTPPPGSGHWMNDQH